MVAGLSAERTIRTTVNLCVCVEIVGEVERLPRKDLKLWKSGLQKEEDCFKRSSQ
jgi:hypothetical protein